ncbi:MAG: hypothetical protein LAO20_01615 [Acidobacteriia bacterium]|nr:hypothetical protein [Terriglobia bacterium]
MRQAQIGADDGINACVYDRYAIKPIDEAAVAQAAQECGAIVTCGRTSA